MSLSTVDGPLPGVCRGGTEWAEHDRDLFMESLRTATLQYKLWASQLTTLGIALRDNKVSLSDAIEAADNMGLLDYLPPPDEAGEAQ